MCRRDNLQVLTLAHSPMGVVKRNPNEAPGRGPISVAPDQERLVARMVKSDEFLDQAFPGRYWLLDRFNVTLIHELFSQLEQQNSPNTCDLMIVDGRLDELAVLHAVSALEFHHHPDTHALLWFIPDDGGHSAYSISRIQVLQAADRIALLGLFGTPLGPRKHHLQGRLTLINFLRGVEKLPGNEYPRSTVDAARSVRL